MDHLREVGSPTRPFQRVSAIRPVRTRTVPPRVWNPCPGIVMT